MDTNVTKIENIQLSNKGFANKGQIQIWRYMDLMDNIIFVQMLKQNVIET